MTQHLYERFGPPAYLPLIDIYPPTAASFPSGEPVIELRGLSRLR